MPAPRWLACSTRPGRSGTSPRRFPSRCSRAGACAGTATFDRQIKAQLRAVTATERRLQLSDLRYRAGFDGRLELLDAQRQLQAARQTLLELRRAEIDNRVALYKSLGGGLHARDIPEIAAVTAAQ